MLLIAQFVTVSAINWKYSWIVLYTYNSIFWIHSIFPVAHAIAERVPRHIHFADFLSGVWMRLFHDTICNQIHQEFMVMVWYKYQYCNGVVMLNN